MDVATKPRYVGYGYHGGGRKPTGVKRVSLALSGKLEELDRLRELAKGAGKTVSSYVLDALVRPAPVELDTEGEKE